MLDKSNSICTTAELDIKVKLIEFLDCLSMGVLIFDSVGVSLLPMQRPEQFYALSHIL